MPKVRLTDLQKRFVEEYLIDLNATQAAIRAGYSEKTAGSIGSENLKKPDVVAQIKRRQTAQVKRTEITQDFVLLELLKIAKADATVFATINGRGSVRLTPTDDLAPEHRAAVAGIKKGKFGTEIKAYDKVKALELLGRHLGLFDNTGDDDSGAEDDGFIDALNGSAREAWADEESGDVPV